MPSSSLVDVDVDVDIGVKVGIEVEVEFEVGVEVEVKARAQIYFFGVGGWLEKWRIKQSSNLKLKLELDNRVFNCNSSNLLKSTSNNSKNVFQSFHFP